MPSRGQFKGDFTAGGLGVREMTREVAVQRRAEQTDDHRPMRAWALLVPERGVPLDLEQFPFQEEWYSEEVANAREVVWQKSTQVGMSASSWRWAARRAEQFGDRVIYFFPTDDDVSDFGDQRIEPSIEDSAFLLKRIPASFVRQKHLKQIGGGWLALRGTQSKTAVQSVDADALVFDEYDLLHQGNLEQAERRLSGAKAAGRYPRVRRLGVPTVPGFGISELYGRSDRRVWHVTCPDCGEEQPLSWEKNVRWQAEHGGPVLQAGRDDYDDPNDVAAAWRVCADCEMTLEPEEGERRGPIHDGRWVATNKGAHVIGFHVSRLIVPRTDLIEIVKNSRKTAPLAVEAFHNNDLGLAYTPAEAALTPEQIDAACSMGGDVQEGYTGRFPVTAGVDVASERALSMRISEHRPDGTRLALWIGEPQDFGEVVEKIQQFKVRLTVIDSMPERRQGRGVAATFPGRVVLASYDWKNNSEAWKYDPKKNMVTVNRTEAIDAMMDAIRQGRNFPLRRPPRRYKEQLLAPKRRTEFDAKGQPVRVYVSTGSEGDDYAHAEVYDLVASEMLRLILHHQKQVKAQGGKLVDERRGLKVPGLASGSDHYEAGFGE